MEKLGNTDNGEDGKHRYWGRLGTQIMEKLGNGTQIN